MSLIFSLQIIIFFKDTVLFQGNNLLPKTFFPFFFSAGDASQNWLTVISLAIFFSGVIFIFLFFIFYFSTRFLTQKFLISNQKIGYLSVFLASRLVFIYLFFIIFVIFPLIGVFIYDFFNVKQEIFYFLKIFLLNLSMTTYAFGFLFSFNWYTLYIVLLVGLLNIILFLAAQLGETTCCLSHGTWKEFFLLWYCAALFFYILIFSRDLVLLFGALSGVSFSIYILLFLSNRRASASEAGVKYFYLSAISSGIMLYGIFLNYFLLNTTNFLFIKWKLINCCYLSYALDFRLLLCSVSFLIVGFLFKLSAFPCQFWAADVYEGSTGFMAAFLLLPVKTVFLSTLYQLLSVYDNYFFRAGNLFLLSLAALGSLLYGCFAAVQERKIKRFFGYTSINQMGFFLLCCFFEIKTSYILFFTYLTFYMLAMLGVFIIFLCVKKQSNKTGETVALVWLSDFNLVGQKYYYYSFGLIVCFFSMAGIPPMGGFFGKFFIFITAADVGAWFFICVGILTSFVSAFYYLKVIKILCFEQYFDIFQEFKVTTSASTNFVLLSHVNQSGPVISNLAISYNRKLLYIFFFIIVSLMTAYYYIFLFLFYFPFLIINL